MAAALVHLYQFFFLLVYFFKQERPMGFSFSLFNFCRRKLEVIEKQKKEKILHIFTLKNLNCFTFWHIFFQTFLCIQRASAKLANID